ncbi:hypothetical protein COX05_04180, partial [candidate division WWE3 bacterium CG22_combo_CG10-13_8_21_14_all_39_12]
MTKDTFNAKLREYAKTVSPTSEERELISGEGGIYKSINNTLDINNTLQIGSYPRFTAITPVHDLDILFVAGSWHDDWSLEQFSPKKAIAGLQKEFENRYTPPQGYAVIKLSPQTHSITIELKSDNHEFSVDIVPAYSFSKNEYGDDMYMVPEIVRVSSHTKRQKVYNQKYARCENIGWIKSDPRGYIKVATEVDQNTDFRKTVKFIKTWKTNLQEEDEGLKLKSFHLEQVVTQMYQADSSLTIYDAIFNFFYYLPDIINVPNQIQDRADPQSYIDEYLDRFNEGQKSKFKQARDGFLIKLENLGVDDDVSDLVDIIFYNRPQSESFMFDKGIKTLVDPNVSIVIDGIVRPLKGFTDGSLRNSLPLKKGLSRGGDKTRRIDFSVVRDT